jgi:integrase/recombinase XerC
MSAGLPATITPRISLPVASTSDVRKAWLGGRKATTLKTYSACLADFSQFLETFIREHPEFAADFAHFLAFDSEYGAMEALISSTHATANRLALSYRNMMHKRGLSSATISLRLAALRSMVRYARQIGCCSFALDVEAPRVVSYRDCKGPGLDGRRSLTSKAKALASDKAGKRNLALIRMMHDLGLRRGECVALDLADVDLGAKTVSIVGKGKTDKEAVSLTSGPALDALTAWIECRGDAPGPLFICLNRTVTSVNEAGELVVKRYQRMSGDAVGNMVSSMGEKAGLSRRVRAHGLRHQGITRALDLSGGDVRKVQRFSRHAKLETLMRYDDARRDEFGAVSKMLGEDD